MLWGADSWLSRTIWNDSSAGAAIDAVENLRSLATTVIAPPAGAEAAGAEAAGLAVGPDPPEQAAVMVARATRHRPRTRRFIGSGLLIGLARGRDDPGRGVRSGAGTL